MKDSIYIKTLELGFKNNSGISFNDIVETLNIDLSDINFEVNFTIWFYSNFYNHNAERLIVGEKTSINSNFRITKDNIESQIRPFNKNKSYIKGDSLNKYIDYLELRSSVKSSKTAVYFSSASLLIAILAIIIPIIFSEYFKPTCEVKITNERNEATKSKLNDSIVRKITKNKMINTKRNSPSELNSKN